MGGGGGGVASVKCEAQAQIFRHAPDLTVRLNPSQSQRERKK